MKLSIRMKIFLPVMVILIAFPLAVWFVFSYTLDGNMNYNARRDMERMIALVDGQVNTDAADRSPGKGEKQDPDNEENDRLFGRLLNLSQNGNGETRMMILGEKYRVLYPRNYDNQPEMIQFYSQFMTRSTTMDADWEEQEITEESFEEKKYMIYYRSFSEEDSETVRNVILYCQIQDTTVILGDVSRLFLLIMGAMAAVSIALFWFVAGSISGPVRRLCEAARGIGEKKFRKVETGATVRELCELENEINQMQDKLLQADQAERTFFQNASHELRTPLMSISGYAQGIQRGVFEDTSQAAGVILEESRRLTEVVDGILTLTRMDQLRYQVVPVEIGICEFIEDELERLEGLAYSKKIKLTFEETKEHRIVTDAMLLTRAFSNVISNCIRYAVTEVKVKAEVIDERIEITITDDGPGIAKEELEHLFDRFYKGKNGNHGLGLAIAKCSMEYMGGNVRAESSPDGAVFILDLPQDCRSFAVEEWKEM